MTGIAKYIPMNPQEHDDMLRAIIISHQGTTDGNPTRWVVEAVHEAFQRGFGTGFNAGLQAARTPPAPPPAFRVELPPPDRGSLRKRLGHVENDITDV